MPRNAATTTLTKTPGKVRADRDLTAVERLIERSDVVVDVAACIRWFWFGLATFVTALTGLIIALYSMPNGEPAIVKSPVSERAAVIGDQIAKQVAN